MADPMTPSLPFGDDDPPINSYAMALGRLEYAALAVVELYDRLALHSSNVSPSFASLASPIERLRSTLARIEAEFPLDRHMTS